MKPLPSREEVQEWVEQNGFWPSPGDTDAQVASWEWSTGWGVLVGVFVGTMNGPVALGWRWL